MAREPWPVNSSTAWTHPITHPIERQTAKGAYQASTNGGMRHTVGISMRSDGSGMKLGFWQGHSNFMDPSIVEYGGSFELIFTRF